MTLPITTTTITVTRDARPATEDPYGAGYDAPAARDDAVSTTAALVPAVVSPAGGTGGNVGGTSQRIDARLVCDPCDIAYGDTVTDDVTGWKYRVEWAVPTTGVAGLGHIAAGLVSDKGRSQ